MFQRSLWGFGDAEPYQMLWAMPGVHSGGLFGKKFGRGVRAAAAGVLWPNEESLALRPYRMAAANGIEEGENQTRRWFPIRLSKT